MTKKTLYLLHGLCAAPNVWEPFRRYSLIDEHFNVCVLDYPLDLDKCSFDVLITHFQKQIEGYEHKEGVLCGHSLGAHLSIRLGEFFPSLKLILVQCSPAVDLKDLFSYFKHSKALEILYKEEWTELEQELIESQLFSSFETGRTLLENHSWRFLRRDLAQDLNHGVYLNEIELLKRRSSKATLILSEGDNLLETDRISKSLSELVPNLKIIRTSGIGHYAFHDSANDWFGSDVKKSFGL